MPIDRNYSVKTTATFHGVASPQAQIPEKASLVSIFNRLSHAGSVESCTFNKSAEMRVTGKYKQACAGGHLLLNPRGIDLRVVPGVIRKVTQVRFPGESDLWRVSFLARDERLVHKATFRFPDPAGRWVDKVIDVESTTCTLPRVGGGDESLESVWRNMKDVHHFYAMLKNRGIGKIEAFRQVPDDLAFPVPTDAVVGILARAHKAGKDIMVFVGNAAVVQIYSGKIGKMVRLKVRGEDKLVLHGTTREGSAAVLKFKPGDFAQAWVVTKMSVDGPTTSIEVFDKDDAHIAQFYGNRSEGRKPDTEWAGWLRALDKLAPPGARAALA